ncbi:Bsp1p [Saccharomyces eubayanus]|uniref:Bsp1p n=1 Tax=Saccharomyces eubayanus TaxID=1080349 RepID=UPI0006BEE2E4|nr:BSP1-like protein [Saccharomyces eubayanus]KOG96453.1 BSP1-like protein [Saccharomyces eubayanus]
MTQYERDPELVNFLSKVEDLDSKRYNSSSITNPSRQPLSPVNNDSPGHRNVRRANTTTTENEERRNRSANLAYRSAYNYEMTFSPKKTHYSLKELDLERATPNSNLNEPRPQNAKEFVISEEDYLLLQKMKASQSPNDYSCSKPSPSFRKDHRVPSRGRPRDKEIVTVQYDFDFQETARLPASSSSSSPTPPPMPTRRSHVQVIEDEEKPMLPIRPAKAEIVERPLRRITKLELPVPEPVKPKPPVSRSTKPTSFLSSLQDNKLTMANSHGSEVETPTKIVKNSHIDYLDSIQLKPATLSSTINNKPKPTPPSPPAKRLPRSESFIKSALNSNLTTTSKPSLPEKPQELRNAKLTVQRAKPSIPPKKVELNLALPDLRPVETSSTKQKFEHSMDLPKLRSSNRNVKKQEDDSIPEAIKNIQNLKKTKHEKPAIPQKKTFLANGLKPTAVETDGDVSKLKNNEPEALSLRNNLKKSPPKAPERKISMPEALRRIELMKKSKTEPALEPAKELSINARLDAIIASKNLRSSNTVPEFNSVKTTAKTSDDINVSKRDEAKETKPLVHVNKNRARGPRRKPPTHV